jgi:hypothetical protein
VDSRELVSYDGQIVELAFADGARERAHIISVDPDVLDNHVFYTLLEIIQPGPPGARPLRVGDGLACSAQDIVSITPTDGQKHRSTPRKPWWRIW